MTNKDFFLAKLTEEASKFRKIIEVLPEDKRAFKVHDKSREAGNITAQIAIQWKGIMGIITNGIPDFDFKELENQTKESMLAKFNAGMKDLQESLSNISDEEWETGKAGWGDDNMNDVKYNMAWSFFFDAIHHRGQLTTYLRNMGEKVPAIYGPSADEQ